MCDHLLTQGRARAREDSGPLSLVQPHPHPIWFMGKVTLSCGLVEGS